MATSSAFADVASHGPAGGRTFTMDLDPPARSWQRWLALLGFAITIGTLIAVFLVAKNLDGVDRLPRLPASPIFWMTLAAAFLFGPAIEWAILRRLWGVSRAAFLPLMRKHAVNELLSGYSGDAQFYLWARRNVPFAEAPFATLRDMAIISGLTSNVATLMIMGAAWKWVPGLAAGPLTRGAVWLILLIVLSAITIAVAQRRFFAFALTSGQIAMVAGAHILRVATMLVLYAALWAMAIPGMTIGALLTLSVTRMMVYRLPFVPGKDALFAASVLAAGLQGATVASVLAMIAGITLAMHAVVATYAGLRELALGTRP